MNIQEKTAIGKKIVAASPRLELTQEETSFLIDRFGLIPCGESIDAILTAFYMGVAVGQKTKGLPRA